MTNKEKKICTTTQTACGSSDCRTFFPDGKFQEPVEKRSLLLHSCCGPCSTAVVERLAEEFNVTVFFYNPCITDQEEYLRRRSAQIQFLEKFNEENIGKTRVLYKEGDYRPGSFYERTKGHESDPEGGARCLLCFRQRLEKTAETASSPAMRFSVRLSALALIRTTKLSPKSDASWRFSMDSRF
ncbi:MAG: epoxyqueuosine reductase QueH [Clostridia bacterium]